MNMTMTTRQMNGVTIVDISGRIVLGEESAALRNLVHELLRNGRNRILFNLAEVDHIDSPGLGYLISACTIVSREHGQVKLLNLRKRVHELMHITRLYTVFDIFDDEAAAIRSFAQPAAISL
jgi:anti-sigma B factor antagonist